MKWISLILLIISLSGCGDPTTTPPTDENAYEDRFEIHRFEGGYLYVDKETGCQYLRGSFGESSFTPVYSNNAGGLKIYCVKD